MPILFNVGLKRSSIAILHDQIEIVTRTDDAFVTINKVVMIWYKSQHFDFWFDCFFIVRGYWYHLGYIFFLGLIFVIGLEDGAKRTVTNFLVNGDKERSTL